MASPENKQTGLKQAQKMKSKTTLACKNYRLRLQQTLDKRGHAQEHVQLICYANYFR